MDEWTSDLTYKLLCAFFWGVVVSQETETFKCYQFWWCLDWLNISLNQLPKYMSFCQLLMWVYNISLTSLNSKPLIWWVLRICLLLIIMTIVQAMISFSRLWSFLYCQVCLWASKVLILSHLGNKPVIVIRSDINISMASIQMSSLACKLASFLILSFMTGRPSCISSVHLQTKWSTRTEHLHFAKFILQTSVWFKIKAEITDFSSQQQEKYTFSYFSNRLLKIFTMCIRIIDI